MLYKKYKNRFRKELFYYKKDPVGSRFILSLLIYPSPSHYERSEAISLKQSRLRRHVVSRNDRFFIQSNDVIPKINLAVVPEFSKKISGIHSSNIISINWIPVLHSVFSEMIAYTASRLHLPVSIILPSNRWSVILGYTLFIIP